MTVLSENLRWVCRWHNIRKVFKLHPLESSVEYDQGCWHISLEVPVHSRRCKSLLTESVCTESVALHCVASARVMFMVPNASFDFKVMAHWISFSQYHLPTPYLHLTSECIIKFRGKISDVENCYHFWNSCTEISPWVSISCKCNVEHLVFKQWGFEGNNSLNSSFPYWDHNTSSSANDNTIAVWE